MRDVPFMLALLALLASGAGGPWMASADAQETPACPGAATVTVFVRNLSADAALEVKVEGRRVDSPGCDGGGATSYPEQTLTCTGSGVVRCGEIAGLRPGAWIHRVRVTVQGSEEQRQAQRRVLVADDPSAGALNAVLWTIYPQTFVVRAATTEKLREAINAAAAFTVGHADPPLPALVTFAGDAFPARIHLPPVTCTEPSTCPLNTTSEGRPAGICLKADRIVVDALDADARPGGVVLSIDDALAQVLRVYGGGNTLRGLVFEGTTAQRRPDDCQFDTVAITGTRARGNRIEDSIIAGPTCGDGVSVDTCAGREDDANVIVASEIHGAEDKGIKVDFDAFAVVERSCVHDNDNGGIQSTLGGHVVASQNLVQRNAGGTGQNGLTVLNSCTTAGCKLGGPRSTLTTEGNVVRRSGGNGLAVTDAAQADFRDDYVAASRVKGSEVQTTPLAPLDDEQVGIAPIARFRGVALVCSSPDTTRGVGAETHRGASDERPPDVSYGDAEEPGRNAFTSNGNNDVPNRGNFLLTNIDSLVSASGNQWAHCGTAPLCAVDDVRTLDIRPAAPDPIAQLVDLGEPLAGPRAGEPVVLGVTPARPQAGDVVRVFGDNFNAIDGNPVRSDCDLVDLPACSSDTDCPTGRCVEERCPCAIESPVVQQRNEGQNGNRVTIRSASGAELITLYPDAVTPTMLAFHMPFDCFAPLTLEVAKRDAPTGAAARAVTLCDPVGCGDQQKGFPCDDGNPCTGDDHCSGDGQCVAGSPRAGAVCREATGPCDLAETCDGLAPDCPPDGFRDVSAVCRPAAGACDVAEHCAGNAASCPDDVKSISECRAAAGDCDVAEVCDGVHDACPGDVKRPDGFVCRGTAGRCDVAETCDGKRGTCPPDEFVASGTVCRPIAGPCDLEEECSGQNAQCPSDRFTPPDTVCRAAKGVCDVAEFCDGTSAACPADGKSTGLCRGSAGDCDVAERCDGINDACPVDAKQPAGSTCRAAIAICDVAESCDGVRNACPPDRFVASGTVCRPPAGPCDVQDLCDGTGPDCPPDAVVAAGSVCRGAAGVCDAVETCDGRGPACPPDTKSTGVCRASAGECDVAERCDGVHDGCPADLKRAGGVICRNAVDLCDVAEVCNGVSTGCPPDGVMAAGTVCRPAAAACDLPEFCDGRSAACPADVAKTTGPTALTCHVDECATPGLHKRMEKLANRIERRIDNGKQPRKKQMKRLSHLLERCGLDAVASIP